MSKILTNRGAYALMKRLQSLVSDDSIKNRSGHNSPEEDLTARGNAIAFFLRGECEHTYTEEWQGHQLCLICGHTTLEDDEG